VAGQMQASGVVGAGVGAGGWLGIDLKGKTASLKYTYLDVMTRLDCGS
jgi:hypothetical protein